MGLLGPELLKTNDFIEILNDILTKNERAAKFAWPYNEIAGWYLVLGCF